MAALNIVAWLYDAIKIWDIRKLNVSLKTNKYLNNETFSGKICRYILKSFVVYIIILLNFKVFVYKNSEA